MPYAQGRTYLDADSHIMELADFLTSNAPASQRLLVPRVPVPEGVAPGRSDVGFDVVGDGGAQPADKVEEMIALGDDLISGPKGYLALGAFNKAERTQALDQLGFHRQLVFSTFAAPVCFNAETNEARYASAAAHNRGIADFCADDPRLMGVGALPLDDPEMALAEVEHMITLGLATAWVPHRPAAGRSPGHDDLDPVWARLANAGIPFVLHVGGQPLQIHPDWMNTGRPVPTDWQGGGENVRSKDMIALHHDAETFIGTMVLDGVFERHTDLRGAVVELGAGWVPSFLRRLDWSSDIWRKSEPELQKLTRKPSEQLTAHMSFTPFVYEDVGALVNESNNELYLFSSDYPHHEGGRNPLGRFERVLEGHTAETLDRFYADNFTRVMTTTTPDAATALDLRPMTGSFGADVHGVDLSKPLDGDTTRAIEAAFAEHMVLAFRDQSLTVDQLEAFALQLGEFGDTPFITPVDGHPNVLAVVREANEGGLLFGGSWHSDWSFQAAPPSATILYGHDVPSAGGDTVFTNQYLAYETLSDGMKRMLGGMNAVHSARRSYGPQGSFGRPDPNAAMHIQGGEEALATQLHPIVRTHPATGRKLLFVNDVYTIGIEDMNSAESKALLGFLLDHSKQVSFLCRVRWQPGTLTMWDNRCVQHHAINDYPGQRREMYRVTLAGEVPT